MYTYIYIIKICYVMFIEHLLIIYIYVYIYIYISLILNYNLKVLNTHKMLFHNFKRLYL